jgi:hypothetical protein
MVIQPGNVLAGDFLQLAGFAVQPGPDNDPGRDAGRPDRLVIPQLPGQEQVPPSGHHADRRKPAQIGLVVIRARPEPVGRGGVPGEVPPESDRRARDVDVSGLQRDLPQSALHPGHLAGVRDDAEWSALLPADLAGPVQRILQGRGAVLVEGLAEPRGGDVERDRYQRRVGVRRDGPLGVAQIAGTGHRHLAVAPRLAPDPGHGGQPVLPFGQEGAELAARAERPAGALDEHLEAPARQRRREKDRRASPAVRRADQHHRQRPVMPAGR